MNTPAGSRNKFWIVILGLLVVAVLVGRQLLVRSATTPAPATEAREATVPAVSPAPAPTVPASMAPSTEPPVAPAEPPQTVLQRIVSHDTNVFKLSPAELQKFLTRNASNAESLLAAFNMTSDKEYLREAVRRHPESAFVLAMALAGGAWPEQQRELIEQFKQAAPDNPLANYLSARDHLKNEQPELAVLELSEASSKKGFHDFTLERMQGLEDMHLGAGHSAAEAKALAMSSLQIPTLRPLRELGREMSALERQYLGAGDTASAEAVAKMGLRLAAHVSNSGAGSLLSQMVGSVVEREILSALDPAASYDFLAQPVNERLAQLLAQDREVRASARFFDHWIQNANEAQLVSYFDRSKLFGESAALRWAKTQLSEGEPAP